MKTLSPLYPLLTVTEDNGGNSLSFIPGSSVFTLLGLRLILKPYCNTQTSDSSPALEKYLPGDLV